MGTFVDTRTSPIMGNVLPDNRPIFDMLTLLRLMVEYNAGTKALPTIIKLDGMKYSPDLLVETYVKHASNVAIGAPFATGRDNAWQGAKQGLRLRAQQEKYIKTPLAENPEFTVPLVEGCDCASEYDFAKGKVASNRAVETDARAIPKTTPGGKSVAATTATFLTSLNRFLLMKRYKRNRDVRTGEMRIISYSARPDVKNPHLYPAISFICTSNMSMVIDVFIANTRLEIFHYAGLQPNMPSVPRSIVESPYVGAITQNEMTSYVNGMHTALLTVRMVVLDAIIKARKTKTLAQVR